MLLFESFISLNAPALTLSFQDDRVKRTDLDFAMKKAVASYRCLRDPSQVAAYKRFLAQCERSLSGVDEVPLLEIVINYLAETDDFDLKDKADCDKLTQLFALNFQNQTDVLSIIDMGRTFIDRPKAFAAFLRSMLARGATPERVLSTYLLQDFLRYDLSSLHQKNNSIEQLYHLFEAFPDTASLNALAKATCCKEGGLSSYALDGSQHKAGSLVIITSVRAPLYFTSNENNLNALHQIFGVSFLMGALYQWLDQKNNAAWVSTVTRQFNQAYTVGTQLPEIVNRLHEYPALQPILAQILSEQTLGILVDRHVGGVLNLMPFCPSLVGKINTQDLPAYLRILSKQSSSGLALITSLFVLFNTFNQSNAASATVVFDMLLDAILADPYVIDDTPMIGKLRKFSHGKDCVIRKARALEEGLDVIIQLQTQSSIDVMDYITIEDVWRDAAEKIQHLQGIMPFNSTCPLDKYKLLNRLARTFLAQKTVLFDLAVFTSAVGVDAVFDRDNITPYERAIIELLATIDDEGLRAQCIETLDTHVHRSWKTYPYGDSGLFTQATLAGNLGFIQWMNTAKIKKTGSYDSLAIVAAQANHWPVVSYFHTQHELKQATINQLLYLAVKQRSLLAMPTLWNAERCVPTLKSIEHAFKLAVELNDTESILCFIQLAKKPCDAVVASCFKFSINNKYFDIAKILAEGFSGGLLLATINQVLKDAARLNQCDVLNALATFKTNLPNQKTLENALMNATRANHLTAVQCLVNSTINPPCLQSIQKARKEARNQHLLNIEEFLSPLCANTYLSEPSISRTCKLTAIQRQGFFKPVVMQDSLGDMSVALSLR